jgi:hypothetical protein
MAATMSSPQRIQFLRFNGYPLPPNAKLVTRPGRWGNRFAIRKAATGWQVVDTKDLLPALREQPLIESSKFAASKTAVRLFEFYGRIGVHRYTADDLADMRATLGGRDLACACPLTDGLGNAWPCHGDVLLAWSNPGGES